MSKRVWVTWEVQRRNRTLSAKFNASLFEFVDSGRGAARYARCISSTFKMLLRERPDYVFVQNPSIVLSALLVVLSYLFRYTVIVDEHNAGLFPQEGRSFVLGVIARCVVRWADYAIVSNKYLVDVVSRWGGRALVLADPLPDFQLSKSEKKSGTGELLNLFMVCTWAADEPYREVIAAAARSPKVTIHVSGKHVGKIDGINVPGNVVLEGFMSESDFLARMKDADAVVVLTTRENCLNCGAYEAVSLNKPMILSNHQALREYFGNGALYVDNSIDGIAQAFSRLSETLPEMMNRVTVQHDKISREWQAQFEKVNEIVFGRSA